MSVISSSSNDSLLHPHLSSIILFDLSYYITKPRSVIFTTSYITNIILLLPLCILILYHGFQQWSQQRSTSTAAMMSHSDSFTYHLVIMELIGVLGSVLCCCGIYIEHYIILFVGLSLWSLTWYGELFFHILTCLERYLAVVNPITYVSLRGERGIRIRNISIGCVWLLSFGGTSLITLEHITMILDLSLLLFYLIIISFCSLSCLCILIRPGPGEQGGDRKRVDQSKQRAFYTMIAILGVLLLRFVSNLIWFVFLAYGSVDIIMMTCVVFLHLPGSLVLPLLFLHKAGTFACCKNNTN